MRGSHFREQWSKSDEIVDSTQPQEDTLEHQRRAVTKRDSKALSNSSPGVEVQRVNPVEGVTEPEAVDPAEKRVPQSLRHRDRAATSEKDKDQGTDTNK